MRVLEWLAVLVAGVVLIGCGGGGQGMVIEVGRPLDPNLVAQRPRLDGPPPEFDLTQIFGVPLHEDVNALRIEDRLDRVVLVPESRALVQWSVVGGEDHLFLRMVDAPIAEGGCPVGLGAREGVETLDALDGFDHPIRAIYRHPFTALGLDVSDPALAPGSLYYLQGCVVDGESTLFTGAETNVVVVEVASALPDLVIREVRRLGPTPETRGRLFIRIADLNAALEREIRSESFDYRVTIRPASGGDASTRFGATAALQSNGSAWIVTPDEVRIPDDGRVHDVTVSINESRVLPESNHHNNSFSADLMARSRPLVLGIDSLAVRENCDGVSPGDWLMLLEAEYFDTAHRVIVDRTFDVDDNRLHTLRVGFRLANSDLATRVRTRLNFVDCDWDSPFFTGFVVPAPLTVWGAATLAEHCGGEELQEIGGRSDEVGEASANFAGIPDGTEVVVTAAAAVADCGVSAYTAAFRLMTQERAAELGYRIIDTLGR